MKKNILSFLFLTTIILSACAQHKKVAKQDTATTAAPGTPATTGIKSAPVDAVPQKPGAIQKLAMERTACFGTCPAYRVEINKNGKVKYISRYFTEYEGTYEKDLDPEKVNELFQQFLKYRVDTCAEEYKNPIQDVPGIIYDITYSNREQHIENAHFGPAFLKDLAREVDSLAKVDDTWTKTAEPIKD